MLCNQCGNEITEGKEIKVGHYLLNRGGIICKNCWEIRQKIHPWYVLGLMFPLFWPFAGLIVLYIANRKAFWLAMGLILSLIFAVIMCIAIMLIYRLGRFK
ncbi:hypothetical protein [endosymbiont GvMRE of Glomus versiforme]|uniref:hypothetical protein n=1 Tax=endosymbiont GvMRE of Glomus versiforme TaxID=2039283 RepID=UPI000ECDCCF5|nr:hypothetical protein [endosymbiont GvMRE of Glomus versiforme]RHZ35817.1 hypothetical protein GvMRE_Ic5g8 [endosymbiont GvMRE of Glomus versiforme]